MAARGNLRPDDYGGEALKFFTTDSPSPYLIESEIEMVGRMGSADTPRARRLARVAAVIVLVAMLIPIVLGALGWLGL